MKKILLLICLLAFAIKSFATQIYSIDIKSTITPVIKEYVSHAIKKTKEDGASLLLIKLDTPGGLLSSTREIVQEILASKVPIVTFVTPAGARAGSAGVFIVLASHVSAMSDTSNIGAATPIGIMGDDVKGDMKNKILSDTVAWARSIAQKYNRNEDFAEKAVTEAKSISANEALKENVIDFIASGEEDLLQKIDGKKINIDNKEIILSTKNISVTNIEMSAKQKLVSFFGNPNLLFILMLLGVLGVFIEFQMPGLILPGVLGVVFLAIVFGVQILPVNWFGAILILCGIAFFITDIYVTSLGLISSVGLGFMIVGSYILFETNEGSFYIDPLLIWSFVILFGILLFSLGYFIYHAKKSSPLSNIEGMIGQSGMLNKPVSGNTPGELYINGSYWKAYSQTGENISEYTRVKIVKIDSTKVYVERV